MRVAGDTDTKWICARGNFHWLSPGGKTDRRREIRRIPISIKKKKKKKKLCTTEIREIPFIIC